MKINFKNGSTIETLPETENRRGTRSHLISCMCYDIENDKLVFVEDLDMRKRPRRFIPEWVLDGSVINER